MIAYICLSISIIILTIIGKAVGIFLTNACEMLIIRFTTNFLSKIFM